MWMNNKALAVAITLATLSCKEADIGGEKRIQVDTYGSDGTRIKEVTYSMGWQYHVMRVEGCEYINFSTYVHGWTHKGDCDNPIHGHCAVIDNR